MKLESINPQIEIEIFALTENLQNAKNIFPNNPDNFDDIGQYQISIIQ